jgi:hypothetical protein
MRYKLEFAKQYVVSGRYVMNILGNLIIFNNGVAYTDSELIMEHARGLRYIIVTKEPTPEASIWYKSRATVEPRPVVVPAVIPTAIDEDVITIESSGTVEPPPVQEEVVEVVSTDTPSAEELQALYKEIGTWKGVAEKLGVSTAILRTYREAAGLV